MGAELNRLIGQLQADVRNQNDRQNRMDERQMERWRELDEKIDCAVAELRKHNNSVHGNFDWRVIGGLASGGLVVAGFIGAKINDLLALLR